MAAMDPEAARMAAQAHAGGFPLDTTINQFQGAAPAATLTAPPAPDSVVTNATDLPVPTARLHAPVVTPAPPVATKAASPKVKEKVPAGMLRWADVGLYGLLATGVWFCWRTRRVSAPVA